jgi:hypothetical protein
MNLLEVKTFVRNCSKEELSDLVKTINTIQRDRRNEAKSQFAVGDIVISDDPRWYYGPGRISKINQKNIVVNCNGTMVNASPGLLKHYAKD